MTRRVYFAPNAPGFDPQRPTIVDLRDALDISQYMVPNGVERGAQRLQGEVREALTRLGQACSVTAQELHDLKQRQTDGEPRPMNTNKRYPTSRPPWARRK